MNGIDVSPWQPANITSLVPYDFAIIKATEGTGYVSRTCDQQYQLAKAAGKGLGVYHFASGGDAVAEADHFINNVQGYLGEAILVLDWEANAVARGREWVRAFVKRVFERTNVHPVIYGSQSPLASANIPGIAADEDCGLWVAAYPSKARTGYVDAEQRLGSVIRQYSSTGLLPGYAGNLDLNKSILTLEQWRYYALGKRTGETKPNTPAPSPLRKSNDEIATEVMRGAWGNGEDRKSRLTAAGYNPQAIQDIINGKYVRKTEDEIVAEVINDKWGIGDDRKARLIEQGYNYESIQKKVNERLKAPVKTPSINIVIPSGASLSNIARQYGTSVAQLLVWNKPKYPSMTANYIQSGWNIKVK